MNTISVVLPVYNSKDYILETLVSVTNQTLAPNEIIVVDDKSTDGTDKIVRAFGEIHKNIKLISLNKNSGGPATPRNIGVETAKGELIAFIDSDDVWHPRKLELQYALIREKNIAFVSSRSWKIISGKAATQTAFLKNNPPEKLNTTLVTWKDFICKNPLCASSIVVRRDVMQKMRFDQRNKYVAIEDYVAWRKIHNGIIDFSYRLEFPFVGYRVHGNSISFSKLRMATRTFHFLMDYHGNPKWLLPRAILEFFGYALYGTFKRGFRRFQSNWH